MQDMQDAPQLTPYLDQLDAECARTGVSLIEACRAEGVADTTLARWRKGEAYCRHDTAQALMQRIGRMAAERAGQAA